MANSFHAKLMIFCRLGKTKWMIKVQSRKLLPGKKVPLSKLKASVYKHIIWSCKLVNMIKSENLEEKVTSVAEKCCSLCREKATPSHAESSRSIYDKIFGLLNKTKKKLKVTKIWLLS